MTTFADQICIHFNKVSEKKNLIKSHRFYILYCLFNDKKALKKFGLRTWCTKVPCG